MPNSMQPSSKKRSTVILICIFFVNFRLIYESGKQVSTLSKMNLTGSIIRKKPEMMNKSGPSSIKKFELSYPARLNRSLSGSVGGNLKIQFMATSVLMISKLVNFISESRRSSALTGIKIENMYVITMICTVLTRLHNWFSTPLKKIERPILADMKAFMVASTLFIAVWIYSSSA